MAKKTTETKRRPHQTLSLNLEEIAQEQPEPETEEPQQAPPSQSIFPDFSANPESPSQNESPQPLPPRKTVGRPKGSKNKVTKSGGTVRPLPENFDTDPALRGYRIMVRPLLGATSRLCRSIDVSPLDEEETESGTLAFSALLYQYGAELDARVLVVLWLLSIGVPRAAEYFEKRATRIKIQKAAGYGDPAEKPVTGQVVGIKQAGS